MNATTEAIPVRFSGNAREYFGIWIVNFLLSIVTLGVYSAWAKVRNKKYFLGNTTIADRPFDYHARGVQILIGREIVVGGIVIFSVSSLISPIVSGVAAVVLAAILPWLINRGLRFNAAMTSWSNVPFRFEGSYWGAFRVFLLYPFLAAFSLNLALPYVTRAVAWYRIGRHRLGGHRFSFDSGIGPFYRAFLLAAAWAVIALALSYALALAVGYTWSADGANQTGGGAASLLPLLPLLIVVIALLPAATIYAAFTRNAIYAGTALEGGHRFESTVAASRLFWISISNAVAIVVSLGMLLPWARIRVARYLCAHTWLKPAGSLDDFVGEAERRQSAIGDAYMDIDGIDVGAAV